MFWNPHLAQLAEDVRVIYKEFKIPYMKEASRIYGWYINAKTWKPTKTKQELMEQVHCEDILCLIRTVLEFAVQNGKFNGVTTVTTLEQMHYNMTKVLTRYMSDKWTIWVSEEVEEKVNEASMLYPHFHPYDKQKTRTLISGEIPLELLQQIAILRLNVMSGFIEAQRVPSFHRRLENRPPYQEEQIFEQLVWIALKSMQDKERRVNVSKRDSLVMKYFSKDMVWQVVREANQRKKALASK